MFQPDWHQKEKSELASFFGVDFAFGLPSAEAEKRLRENGENKIEDKRRFSGWLIFLSQFKSPLIYILVLAGIVSFILRHFSDAVVIFGAVFINTIVGYIQEAKASKALEKLKILVDRKAIVLRDGSKKEIPAESVVAGDVLLLRAGDRISADSRLIETDGLKVNEAVLTGEWLGAEKMAEKIDKEAGLADRKNCVFMGTIVEEGRGVAVATAVGAQTELGKIAGALAEKEDEMTPLQRRLTQLSKFIGMVVLVFSIFIFIAGILNNQDPAGMFIMSIAVAVAAIPEGLPVAMTIVLAIGMRRILKKKGLVRKLVAAETLGSASIICTDKTGTLTTGEMKLERSESFDLADKEAEEFGFKIGALCNESFVENPEAHAGEWKIVGHPTSKALILGSAENGFKKHDLEREYTALGFLPFDSDSKFIASAHEKNGEKILFVVGAPEKILNMCGFYFHRGKAEDISSDEKERLFLRLEDLSKEGLRVLAAAFRKADHFNGFSDFKIDNLCFVSFLVLRDPLRKGVKEMIEISKRAGLKSVVVTGDHKLTAEKIAKEAGISGENDISIGGKELDAMSDEELDEKLPIISVFARVEPRHKIRIVERWQARGEVVAMSGDGVNDAPALKKADIGVAVGSATDVTKEAADLILLEDNFGVIVSAIKQGRVILDNIRKVILYLLSDSFTEVILVGGSLLFGLPLPVLPVQILWVNIVEDSLPNIALTFEPEEEDVMRRGPKKRKMPLMTQSMKTIIFLIGVSTDFLLFILYWFLVRNDSSLEHVRTMIFVSLAIGSLFYAFSCRSLRRPIWKIKFFSNKFLIFSQLFGLVMILSAVYVPFLQNLLGTIPLNWSDWLIILPIGIINLILIEAGKYYFIHKKKLD